MPFLLRTAITILFLFAFDLQIGLFAGTPERFVISQQVFEKLFLLAKFVKACFGNLEDFAKRDVVKDEIGGGELPLYIGLEFFGKGSQRDML